MGPERRRFCLQSLLTLSSAQNDIGYFMSIIENSPRFPAIHHIVGIFKLLQEIYHVVALLTIFNIVNYFWSGNLILLISMVKLVFMFYFCMIYMVLVYHLFVVVHHNRRVGYLVMVIR